LVNAKNVVILREKILDKNLELSAIEESEKNILVESSWKINTISISEIAILIFKFLYGENFKLKEITNNNTNSIYIYIYQVSMMIFRSCISDFSIYSKFPEHIILISSILINLNREGEFKALMKFQKEFTKECREIQECIILVEKFVKKIFNEDNQLEDEDNEMELYNNDNLGFAKFFKNENLSHSL
jgi:hypothetical protein